MLGQGCGSAEGAGVSPLKKPAIARYVPQLACPCANNGTCTEGWCCLGKGVVHGQCLFTVNQIASACVGLKTITLTSVRLGQRPTPAQQKEHHPQPAYHAEPHQYHRWDHQQMEPANFITAETTPQSIRTRRCLCRPLSSITMTCSLMMITCSMSPQTTGTPNRVQSPEHHSFFR